MRNQKLITQKDSECKGKKMHLGHDFQMGCPSKSNSDQDQVNEGHKSTTKARR